MKKGFRRKDICLVCGCEYYKYRNALKYCSRSCSAKLKKIEIDDKYKEILRERIKEKSYVDENTGCWIWKKYKNKEGRGQCYFNKTTVHAYRVSFICFVKDIPDGICVCHKCDNYSCVNPEHLFLGTDQDNADDRENKKRGAKGEKIGQSKLKEFMILEIRNLKLQGLTEKEISQMYNVSQTCINRIVNFKTWKHI